MTRNLRDLIEQGKDRERLQAIEEALRGHYSFMHHWPTNELVVLAHRALDQAMAAASMTARTPREEALWEAERAVLTHADAWASAPKGEDERLGVELVRAVFKWRQVRNIPPAELGHSHATKH